MEISNGKACSSEVKTTLNHLSQSHYEIKHEVEHLIQPSGPSSESGDMVLSGLPVQYQFALQFDEITPSFYTGNSTLLPFRFISFSFWWLEHEFLVSLRFSPLKHTERHFPPFNVKLVNLETNEVHTDAMNWCIYFHLLDGYGRVVDEKLGDDKVNRISFDTNHQKQTKTKKKN